jgi:hypothetical protein
MASWGGVWNGLRATGHALLYATMGGVCVAFIVMGVIAVAGRDRPVYWGTFTETSTACEPGPRGSCTNSGRWVSDDGTIVKDGVTLDGFVERGRSVRASYQPGGPMGDDENDIVHTGSWSKAGLWFPWVAAAVSAAAIWYQHRRWHRDAPDRQYQGRHSESDSDD